MYEDFCSQQYRTDVYLSIHVKYMCLSGMTGKYSTFIQGVVNSLMSLMRIGRY